MKRTESTRLPQPRFFRAGDSAIVVEIVPEGDENSSNARIDLPTNARCIAIANEVRRCELPGVRDVVAAYRSVTVYFDPLRTAHARLVEELKRVTRDLPSTAAAPGRLHRVPVCYGTEFGPDLPAVAAFGRLSVDEAIARHSAIDYRVFMLGFIPGFAYLGIVDKRIAAPRREVPRTRVPAGSVAIAAEQTGIYPMESPGGWQLIGRTPVRIFESSRSRPSLFQAGDVVRFFSISRQEWDQYAS
jgi:KipI family sensor histidine kinase inhibitor